MAKDLADVCRLACVTSTAALASELEALQAPIPGRHGKRRLHEVEEDAMALSRRVGGRAWALLGVAMLTLTCCGVANSDIRAATAAATAPSANPVVSSPSPRNPNGGAPSGPSSSRHVARPVGTVAGTTSGFWEYVPPHYGNGDRYPLLVFWHGLGENGDGSLADLAKVPANGPPRLLNEDRWPEERPFIVLSPQHPGTDCPSSQELDAFLRFAISHYDVDLRRVYLTGLSCGAIGSFRYLADHLDEFVAAAVLVCGDGRNAIAQAGCALGRVPIWALHGELDPAVPVAGSIEPLTQLAACHPPAADAKLTIYPGVGHDSWTQTYDLSSGNDVYAWLLSHSKP